MCRCGSQRPLVDPARSGWLGKADEIRAAATARLAPFIADGIESETYLPKAWRVLFRVAFVFIVLAVFTGMTRHTFRERVPTRGNIEVLARLDEHARKATSSKSNAIPSFLALPGRLGAIDPSAPSSEPVKTVDTARLAEGFCASSTAQLARHENPGLYERWSDARLEQAVVAKNPDWKGKVCVLSYALDADPDDIVKYELKPRTLLALTGLGLWILLVTGGCALACVIVYFRYIVDYLESIPRKSSTGRGLSQSGS